jgi:predicted phosphodiesterase
MRLQLASDLHLELIERRFPGERLIEPAPGADVLVLAGDIHRGTRAIELFGDWPVPVLYLAGNHEFYGHRWDLARQDLRRAAAGTAVHFLDNDEADFGGVRFLGSTLWTDYRVPGVAQAAAMQAAEGFLLDHRRILTHDGPLRAEQALEEHRRSRQWLARRLERGDGRPTVVVTHHGPHPGSIHPRFAGSPVNGAFVSDLTDLLGQADLWLHGHVHDSFDYRVGRCRVLTNPRGYAAGRAQAAGPDELTFENAAFDRQLVIDVAVIDVGVGEAGGPRR